MGSAKTDSPASPNTNRTSPHLSVAHKNPRAPATKSERKRGLDMFITIPSTIMHYGNTATAHPHPHATTAGFRAFILAGIVADCPAVFAASWLTSSLSIPATTRPADRGSARRGSDWKLLAAATMISPIYRRHRAIGGFSCRKSLCSKAIGKCDSRFPESPYTGSQEASDVSLPRRVDPGQLTLNLTIERREYTMLSGAVKRIVLPVTGRIPGS